MTSGRPSADDDEDLPELPHADAGEDEAVGVADSDELLFNDLADEPEEVGLDTDALGAADAGADLDEDEEEEEGGLDEAPLEIDAEIDAEGEEHGWTEDNEGAGDAWDEELPQDLADEQGIDDDAGAEGVDDPLLDGLPEERGADLSNDDDDEEEEDGDDAWAEELSREIGADA